MLDKGSDGAAVAARSRKRATLAATIVMLSMLAFACCGWFVSQAQAANGITVATSEKTRIVHPTTKWACRFEAVRWTGSWAHPTGWLDYGTWWTTEANAASIPTLTPAVPDNLADALQRDCNRERLGFFDTASSSVQAGTGVRISLEADDVPGNAMNDWVNGYISTNWIGAIKMSIISGTDSGDLEYCVLTSDGTWSPWCKAGRNSVFGPVAGSANAEGKPIVAYGLRLTGDLGQHYNISYNASVRDYGTWDDTGGYGKDRDCQRYRANVNGLPYPYTSGYMDGSDTTFTSTNGWTNPQYDLPSSYTLNVSDGRISADSLMNSGGMSTGSPFARPVGGVYAMVYNISPKLYNVTWKWGNGPHKGEVIKTQSVMYGDYADEDPSVSAPDGYRITKQANGKNFRTTSGNYSIANGEVSGSVAGAYVSGPTVREVYIESAVETPTKTVNKTRAEVGDTVDYTVVQRVGSGAAISSFEMIDPLPANTEYVEGSFRAYNGAGTLLPSSAGNFKVSGNRLIYTFEQNWLSVNAPTMGNITFRFSVKVLDAAAPSTLRNSAIVRVNGTSQVTPEVTTEVPVWYVKLHKSTDYPAVMDGNPAYDLSNAEFTVTGPGATGVSTVRADVRRPDGSYETAPIRLVHSGSHRATETEAPKGFAPPNPDYQDFTLTQSNQNQTLTLDFVDPPIVLDLGNTPIGIKTDYDYFMLTGGTDRVFGNADAPWQGNSPNFSGTKVRIDFYAGNKPTGTKLASAVFQSDAQGNILFSTATPVDGTTWRYVYKGHNVLPLGTVVVTEVAAPTGYTVDNTQRVAHIVQDNVTAVLEPVSHWHGR